jgi:hypothetical protein
LNNPSADLVDSVIYEESIKATEVSVKDLESMHLSFVEIVSDLDVESATLKSEMKKPQTAPAPTIYKSAPAIDWSDSIADYYAQLAAAIRGDGEQVKVTKKRSDKQS